jgi:hypothetical protein
MPHRAAVAIAAAARGSAGIRGVGAFATTLSFWHSECRHKELWRRSGSAPIDGNGRAHRSESESRGLRGSTPNARRFPPGNFGTRLPGVPGAPVRGNPPIKLIGGFLVFGSLAAAPETRGVRRRLRNCRSCRRRWSRRGVRR